MERAKVEKQYAQQLSQWSSKWKSIVDSREYEALHDNCAEQRTEIPRLFWSSQLFKLKWPLLSLNKSICACLKSSSAQMEIIVSLLFPWLTSVRCYFIAPSVFFLLPQGHFMAPSWRRGSVSSPPPSACRNSTPQSPKHSSLKKGNVWRPGRRRPSPRKSSVDSRRAMTTTRVFHEPRNPGPKSWLRFRTHAIHHLHLPVTQEAWHMQ